MAQNNIHLEHFNYIPDAGLYEESSPQFFDPRNKLEHGVLLIHGFSASTNEFQYLTGLLKEKHIPYYIPMLTGFGIDTTEKLRHISTKDWLRDVINAYRLLQSVCNKVSIVAHSMGCTLALYLAQNFPVDKLVLSAPYIMPKSNQQLLKKLLLTPGFSQIISFFRSSIKKNSKNDLKKISESKRFVYTKVPIQSVKTLWALTDKIDLTKLQYGSLYILSGKNDGTIEIDKVLGKFNSTGHSYKHIEFENSGHNILEDKEHVQASEIVSNILLG
jgi:carboxylesterase